MQGVTYLEEVSRFAKREPEAFQIVLDLVDGEVGPETARIVRGYQYWQQVECDQTSSSRFVCFGLLQ